MASKFLLGMLLCSTMAFSQVIKVETIVQTDSLATYIMGKDKTIELIMADNRELEAVLRHKDMLIDQANDTINSLLWYKMYYMHSKHVITPRVIARIEEMIGHE